jgi:hypothetical protein
MPAKKVAVKLTPDEAEQTLRALNAAGMTGVPPYFKQDVLMSSAIKITDAMTAAGIDHKESAKT